MKGEQRQQGMNFEPLGQILFRVLRTAQAKRVGLAKGEIKASPVSARKREGNVQKFVERIMER